MKDYLIYTGTAIFTVAATCVLGLSIGKFLSWKFPIEPSKVMVQERCYDGLTYVEFHEGTYRWATTKLNRITGQPVACFVKESK